MTADDICIQVFIKDVKHVTKAEAALKCPLNQVAFFQLLLYLNDKQLSLYSTTVLQLLLHYHML